MNENNKIKRINLLARLLREAKYSEYLEGLSKEYPSLQSLIGCYRTKVKFVPQA